MGRASTISMGAWRSRDTRILREADSSSRRMGPSVAAGAAAAAVIRIAVFHQDGGETDQIEVHGLGAGGGEADAEGVALPSGFATGGGGWAGRGGGGGGPRGGLLWPGGPGAARP